MSTATPLIALITRTGESAGEAIVIHSPAVGILRGVPTPGHLFGPGEAFATLTVLDRTHALLIPEGVSGLVAEIEVDGHGADAISVEFGQPIFKLAPIEAALKAGGVSAAGHAAGGPAAGPTAEPGAASGGAAPEAIPEGCHAVLCPADGVFYRRSRPTEPPYVEVGSRVHEGQTLALIEAMKCFSAITYGAPGLPEEAEIVEIRAEDAAEVRHGQVLLVVR